MTGEKALKEIEKKITDEINAGKKPIKVLIPSTYKNALITINSSVIGSELKSKIATIGVKEAFPTILGIPTEWDAVKLEVLCEKDT